MSFLIELEIRYFYLLIIVTKLIKIYLPAHFPLIVLNHSKRFSFVLGLQFRLDLTEKTIHIYQNNKSVA